MTVPSLRKYVIINKNIKALDDFVNDSKDNAWVLEICTEIKEKQNYPENCISVYYLIDIIDKKLIEKLYVAIWHSNYHSAFKEISVGWIEEFFVVEDTDLKQLNAPEKEILSAGSEIFSLINSDNQVVGVTVMHNHKNHHTEFGKMGVKAGFKGRGYSNILMSEGIFWTKNHPSKFPYINIHTVTCLIPAIALFKKFGFETAPLDDEIKLKYARADLAMRLYL